MNNGVTGLIFSHAILVVISVSFYRTSEIVNEMIIDYCLLFLRL